MKTHKHIIISGSLLLITICFGIALSSVYTYADTTTSKTNASVNVPVSCYMSGTVDSAHNATLPAGTYSGTSTDYANGIGKTTLTSYCNDANGFSIYAIGYGGNTDGNNKMIGTSASGNAEISTKVYASGDTTSNWSMKVTKVTDPAISYNPNNMYIDSDTNGTFGSWHVVPSEYTRVAHYKATTGSSATDSGTNAKGAKVETTYASYIAPTQAADTYTGKVKYIILHPYNSEADLLNVPCDNNYLCVEYDSNGLDFSLASLNHVNYDSTVDAGPVNRYSRSAYNEDGTYGGYTTPGGNNVVTIPGSSSLHLRITYGVPPNTGGPASYLYIWPGNYPSNTNTNNDTSLTSCGATNAVDGAFYSPRSTPNTQVTMECDIAGDSVTFYDYSTDPVSTGYYAVVTGDLSGTRTKVSGFYEAPTSSNGTFYGWSSTRTTAGSGTPSDVEYVDEAAIESHLPGSNGEKKTVYAVWQQGRTITFNKDANISSIQLLDSNDNVINTITSDGQQVVLYQNDTYTLKPIYGTAYTLNAITKTSGAGTLSYEAFTVGNGDATISVTSKGPLPAMQNYSCSNIANVGDIIEAYDTRDNEVYHIGKLADGNCWMLDNLALDLVARIDDINPSNTNASSEMLNYLKNGGGSNDPASDVYDYASSPVSYWTSGYYRSYSDPKINVDYKDDIPPDATSQAGRYRTGGYYNLCAASAGSVCYGNGRTTIASYHPRIDVAEDICPKGWRLPTGGNSEFGPADGEYLHLSDSYTTLNDYRAALRLPLHGFIYSDLQDDDLIRELGMEGGFWSSTYYQTYDTFMLHITSDSIDSGNHYSYNARGNAVRCVTKQ